MIYEPCWYEYLYLPLFLFVVIGGLFYLGKLKEEK